MTGGNVASYLSALEDALSYCRSSQELPEGSLKVNDDYDVIKFWELAGSDKKGGGAPASDEEVRIASGQERAKW